MKQAFYQLEHEFWSSLSKTYVISPFVTAYYNEFSDVSGFNFIYVHEGAALSDIEIGLAWFKARARDCLVVYQKIDGIGLTDPTIAGLGLTKDYPTTAMVLDTDQWIHLKGQKDQYEAGQTGNDLSEWVKPLITAFGVDEEAGGEPDDTIAKQYQKAHESAVSQKAPLHHFVMKVNNEPICNLTLTIVGNYARFDDIGTDIHHQRKGYATILIQQALMFAVERGVTHCFLESSTIGLSIYKKLGFVELFEYEAYEKVNSAAISL